MAEALLERRRRRREDPLRYFDPHAKQREFLSCAKALRALFWGNRVGKTEVGAYEAARVMLGEHPFIAQSDGWVFSPSFEEQVDTTQAKLLRYVPDSRIDWQKTTWIRKGIIRDLVTKDGAKATFKSYEQGREKVQGAGKGWVWFDEEPPLDVFEEASVRSEAGQPLHIWLTMTPVKGLTWVYDRIYLNTANPDQFVSTATWEDNPHLTEEQKSQMAGRLTGNALKVRREGRFMRQVGLVASWFDRSVHVVDLPEVLEHDLWQGIDFGFSNPACCLWVNVDAEENVLVYDGYYAKGMVNRDHLEEIRRREEAQGVTTRVRRVGDSAQAGDLEELRRAKLRIDGVEKQSGSSHENWDEWRAKLMEELGRVPEPTEADPNPRPRLLISSSLVAHDEDGNPFNFLVRELENLRWEEAKTEAGVAPKSVWGRQPNHAIDALTYILASIERSRDRGAGRIVRAEPDPLKGMKREPTAQEIVSALMKPVIKKR